MKVSVHSGTLQTYYRHVALSLDKYVSCIRIYAMGRAVDLAEILVGKLGLKYKQDYEFRWKYYKDWNWYGKEVDAIVVTLLAYPAAIEKREYRV